MAFDLDDLRDFFGEDAERFGLVEVGGDLAPDRLLHAYQNGIFPWYDEPLPVCWWSPDPRAIFELGDLGDPDGLHVSRRLRRTYRSGRFTLTVNQDFVGVMKGCADRPGEGTWITPAMFAAYTELHRLGHAHSVEAWQNGELAGGVYGVAIGGFFAGESMFHRRTDASNVALVYLAEHLRERGFSLFDTQMLTEHTARMGAIEVPRAEYMRRLKEAIARRVTFVD